MSSEPPRRLNGTCAEPSWTFIIVTIAILLALTVIGAYVAFMFIDPVYWRYPHAWTVWEASR